MAAAKYPRVHIEVANTYSGDQSWYFREIFTQNEHKVRVSIRVNSYDFQSHARVEVWHGMAWSVIHSIPHANMVSNKKVSYVQKNVGVTPFMDDRNVLVDMAEKILF